MGKIIEKTECSAKNKTLFFFNGLIYLYLYPLVVNVNVV